MENYRLPKEKGERTRLAEQIGADGLQLLHALEHPQAPVGLNALASVQVLRQVWEQYYELTDGLAQLRDDPVAGHKGGVIRSPYDPQARTGVTFASRVLKASPPLPATIFGPWRSTHPILTR